MICLLYLSGHHGLLPTSFSCSDAKRIGTRPVWGGGFADIWRGRMTGNQICIKVLRMFINNDIEKREKTLKNFCHEALVWRNLNHANILPFLGVNKQLFAPSFCLISSWMQYGNIMSFLTDHPEHDRLMAITEVARGMSYLHSLKPCIVHADIRGANILVRDDLSCCLSDFGLALAVESQAPSGSCSSSTFLAGSLRWMPPEIINNDLFDKRYITALDVYSFGCTIIEIYTGNPPFAHIRKEAAIINEMLTEGNQPELPSEMSFGLWELVKQCLVSSAGDRPASEDLMSRLEAYNLGEDVDR
ncbi:kinase-like domain-containing protein [Armillaria nabsnona]|nr:kinase-like domain-containing protein [Armillaria nabsnona]